MVVRFRGRPERLAAVIATYARFLALRTGTEVEYTPACLDGRALHDACVAVCDQIHFIMGEEDRPLNGAPLRHPGALPLRHPGAFFAGQLADLAAHITRVYNKPDPPRVAFLVVRDLLQVEPCCY